ncbi:ketoacyl-ACP synthase III [Christensenellaceae bacterium OttesenSCG-928-M15]|nr:ketoacyl-ACP synthase III [Christensenellaceae bacterium OttesenSCG-928-M15]
MRIIGTGSAIPKLNVKNDELSAFLDTSDEWITTRTGIRERRVISDETLEELALQAAKNALEMAQLSPGDIDFILFSNVYNAYRTPGLGCILQGMLNANCASIDINGACAGFLYALEMAQAYTKSGTYQTILVVCAEENSRMADWSDRSTCVLFGDAAAAAIVTADGPDAQFKMSNQACPAFLNATNPSGNSPYRKHPMDGSAIYMNGQEVYKFAVSTATSDLRALMSGAGLLAEDVSLFILHQANLRIIEAIRTRFKQPPEKFPTNIAHYGNTSSASVPLLMDELNRSGKLQRGMTLALSAFGAGLTAGACLLQW